MIFLTHVSMAYFIWAWVVRKREVGVLQSQVPWAFAGTVLLSAGLTMVPIYNRNLGLWSYADCFVRRSGFDPRRPAPGIIADRWVVLPLSWLAVLVLNGWTIYRLRRETRRLYELSSVKRLQLRLMLITVAFSVLWLAYLLSSYIKRRTFALEFWTKWAFGIGFVDAMVYGASV